MESLRRPEVIQIFLISLVGLLLARRCCFSAHTTVPSGCWFVGRPSRRINAWLPSHASNQARRSRDFDTEATTSPMQPDATLVPASACALPSTQAHHITTTSPHHIITSSSNVAPLAFY